MLAEYSSGNGPVRMNTFGDPRSVLERWYEALAAGELVGVIAAFHPAVVAGIIGSTSFSERFTGRDHFTMETLRALMDALDHQQTRLAGSWSIISADGQRVVGTMTGDMAAENGRPDDSAYRQQFAIGDGQIIEYLEFADTVLIEAAIFDNPLERPSELQREPLSLTAAGRARNGGGDGRD
jgi:ketosteroid isomerase-like protein